MLRNGIILNSCIKQIECELYRKICSISAFGINYAKANNINRQVKIMGKLFGERMSGSKKRWYPTSESTSNPANGLFKSSNFGKPTKAIGKNTSRRMNVLNKLFMEHITGLLVTGEVSDKIVNRGLQITRVKTSIDFSHMSVYWLGNGDVISDGALEQELQKCSGIIRHELSQLALMGEVPRIHFVREKMHANLFAVESLLKNIDFSAINNDEVDNDEADQQQHYAYDELSTKKNEFFGKEISLPKLVATVEEAKYNFPEMRHEVLGLDHKNIMSRILAKMKKSKQAWNIHLQKLEQDSSCQEISNSSQLDLINKQLAKSAEASEQMNKFLSKRNDRKETPERKKFNIFDHPIDLRANATIDYNKEAIMTAEQKRIMNEEDIFDENEKRSSDF